MTSATGPDLAAIPLFRGLTTTELAQLGAMLHARTLPAGALIIGPEQGGDTAYVIQGGFVQVQVDQADGSRVLLAILGPGSLVGEMSLVDDLGRSASVVARADVTLLGIGRTAFWECLRTYPAMAYNVASILSRRLRRANEQIQALASLDVEGRVARQVLAFGKEHGRPVGGEARIIPFPLTQGDLADLVGASRVRVNQVLGGFKRARYLSVDDGHRITIHNAAGLGERCLHAGPGMAEWASDSPPRHPC